ncbi:hypothetical protein ILYODFUR_032174 [Ilyodon furcidens]|uniref:Uncharacterized protein n=1 Tax=Ilyodon furcidens TaxID=33524 RepID=A0ABV0VLV5_9TELE
MNMLYSKLFHCSSGCIFRVVVQLKGEPLPQSQVFCCFLQVSFQNYSTLYLPSSIFHLTSFPVPAVGKHSYSMMLPLPCLTVWMVCSRECAVLVFCLNLK